MVESANISAVGLQTIAEVTIRHEFIERAAIYGGTATDYEWRTPILDFSASFCSVEGVSESTQFTKCKGCGKSLAYLIRQKVCYVFTRDDFRESYGEELKATLLKVYRQNTSVEKGCAVALFLFLIPGAVAAILWNKGLSSNIVWSVSGATLAILIIVKFALRKLVNFLRGPYQLDFSNGIMVTEQELLIAGYDPDLLRDMPAVTAITQIVNKEQTIYSRDAIHALVEAELTTGISFTEKDIAESLNSRHVNDCVKRMKDFIPSSLDQS